MDNAISFSKRNGTIKIDEGASKALRNGKSLLAAGVIRINGSFKKGENVVEVLNGVNLTLNQGELIAIIGPSGSGKTTLLQIIGLLDTFSYFLNYFCKISPYSTMKNKKPAP